MNELRKHGFLQRGEALPGTRIATRKVLVVRLAPGVVPAELRLGKSQRAAPLLDQARLRAAGHPRTDPSVSAALVHQSARAEFVAFRPDRALEILRPLEPSSAKLPQRLGGEVSALSATSRRLVGESSPEPAALRPELWSRLKQALETERSRGAQASAEDLARLATEIPGEPSIWLQLGRTLLASQRAGEALEWLDRADASQGLPEPWVGPCRLLAGQAADLAGRRQDALVRYRKALKSPAFVQRNAAYLSLQFPYPQEP